MYTLLFKSFLTQLFAQKSRKQFFKFVVIGGFCTLSSYIIFYILYKALHVHYLTSNALGFLIMVFVNYTLNKKITFKSKNDSLSKIIKYYSVYLCSLIIGLLFLKLLVDLFNFLPEIASIFVIGLTTCINFIGIKFLIFKK